MTKKVLLAGAAVIALTGVAGAADLPTKARAYDPVPAGFSWTGIYIGAHGGYEFGALDISTNGTGSLTAIQNSGVLGTNPSGGFGGGHIGFNYQFAPAWVLGLRGDIDVSGLEGTTVDPATSIGMSHSVPWHGDVVGRLGYLVTPTVMFYGVGGVAFGEIKDGATATINSGLREVIPITGSVVSTNNTHTGYVAGAGLEWFFNPNMSIGVEWNYYNLGTHGVTFVGADPANTFNINDKAAWNAIKANLSIKF